MKGYCIDSEYKHPRALGSPKKAKPKKPEHDDLKDGYAEIERGNCWEDNRRRHGNNGGRSF